MSRLKGDRWFYHSTQKKYAHPDEFDLTFDSVHFQSEQCLLHGWYFPAKGHSKGTVVHCHGTGGNMTGHFKYITWMPERGWNVFCFDYRGFGESKGLSSRPGAVADAHAAIDYVRGRRDAEAEPIVLFGQSMGGAVGIVVASQCDDLYGVAIEGAFSSFRGAMQYVCRKTWYLWGLAPWLPQLLVEEGLDPIDHVADISPTPVWFVTGTHDRVCDPKQTLEMYKRAGEPKSLWVIDGGGHTGALRQTDQNGGMAVGEGPDRLDSFFSECVTKGKSNG